MNGATNGPGAAGLTDAELDQLADFIADVLEPGEADHVAQLVADEPRWAAAHEALVMADAAVRTDLVALAQPRLAMPADIAARLDDALRRLSRTPAADDTAPTPGDTTSTERGTVSSLDAARARRRRIHRITAIAAGVVAVVGGVGAGISVLGDWNLTTLGTAANAPNREYASDTGSPPESALGSGAVPELFASQRDYTLGTLDQVSSAEEAAPVAPAAGTDVAGSPNSITKDSEGRSQTLRVPDGLARLLDPAALAECLTAIRSVFPGVVSAVDYAKFSGRPSVIVLVQQAGGRTAVAVGPDCGRAGPDEQASVPVR